MGVATPLKVPTCAGASQIQVFLLGGNRKRVLVRVERTTVFSEIRDLKF